MAETRLDVGGLAERAAFYFAQGLADSSICTYRSGQKRYITFCDRSSMSPLPLSEQGLCNFVAHLADEHLKHRMIKTYLSGLRFLEIKAGLSDPFQGSIPRLTYILRGIRVNEAKHGSGTKERLPITPGILRKLHAVWSPNGHEHDTKLVWAASCLCFFAFLRVGEMTVPSDHSFDPAVHLGIGDLALDHASSPSALHITIKRSKTDPFRHGVDLWVGKTGSDLCPVAAVLDYLKARGSRVGPLFVFADGRLLTRQRFIDRVRSALGAAGIDQSKYCSHNFRIGAARGIEDCVIKTLGRWESLAYLRYVRLPREQLAGTSSQLAAPLGPLMA